MNINNCMDLDLSFSFQIKKWLTFFLQKFYKILYSLFSKHESIDLFEIYFPII